MNGCVCVKLRKCERAGMIVSKWGASGLRESVISYFMFDINLKFIVVCIFLLPVKAALHHGELYIITQEYYCGLNYEFFFCP